MEKGEKLLTSADSKNNTKSRNREIDKIALLAQENDEDCMEILMELSMPIILNKSMKFNVKKGSICDFDDLISTSIYITAVGIKKYDFEKSGFFPFLKKYLDWKLRAHVFGKENLPELPKDHPFFYREKHEETVIDLYENDYLVGEDNCVVRELEDALIEYSGKNRERFEKIKNVFNDIL